MATNPDINLPLNLKRFTAPNALTTAQPDGTQLVSLDDNGLALTTGGDVGTVLKSIGIPKAAFQLATSSLQAGLVPQTLTLAYASMHLTQGMTVDLNYNFASADPSYNDFAFAVLVDANDYSSIQPLLLADQKHFQQQYGGLTGLDRAYALLQGYHAGQHFAVDHTGDYRLLVGVADVGDKTGVSELKLLDVSLGVPGASYSVTTNFGGKGIGGLQLSDGSLLDLIGEQLNADGTAALGQTLDGPGRVGGSLIGAAGQSIIVDDFRNAVAQNVVNALTGSGGTLATQAGGAVNPLAGGLASLTPTTTVAGVGVVPTNAAALIQFNGGNAALATYSTVVSNDGGSLISQDGGGLIGKTGAGLIPQDGGGLISQDGGGLISQDGGGVISNDGGSLGPSRATALFKPNGAGFGAAPQSAFVTSAAAQVASASALRLYTLTGDPGVAPAAPPVAGPLTIASDAASGATIRNNPATAGLSDGRYVTVWTDNLFYQDSGGIIFNNGNYEIRGQMFNADGTKFAGQALNPNGTPSNGLLTISPFAGISQTAPSITGLANGRFVVTWTGGDLSQGRSTLIEAQFFNADGTQSGSTVVVRPTPVSTTLSTSRGNQTQSSTASLFGGGAVVTYRTETASGFNNILGQRYAADGTVVGGPIAVGPSYSADVQSPAAAGLQDGGFVVAYTQNSAIVSNPGGGSSSPTGIYVQRFAATGASAGAPVQVNTAAAQTYLGLDSPAVAVLQDGSFVVSYRSEPSSSSGTASVLAQRFTAAGAPVGGEVTVASNADQAVYRSTPQDQPVITALRDGGYAIAWAAPGGGTNGTVIQAQVLSADGTKQGASFTVSGAKPTDFLSNPAINTLLDGRLYIAGSDYNGTGSDIRAETLAFPTTATAPITYGRVLDGLVKGATVFADANGNGKLDAGEATAVTDAQGRFTFATRASGSVIATGGTDVSTGLPFTSTYTAPAGSLSVTALSTLVQKVMAARGSSVGEALLRVAGALGLSVKTDLTSFNPITSTLNGVVDAGKALVADAVVTNTLALAKAAGATGDLYGKLASQIAAASYGVVDPTAVATLQGLGMDYFTANDASIFAKAGADLLAAKLASGESALTLVHDVTGANKVLQGAAAPDLVAGEAKGFIGPAVTKYTGDNLAAQVGAASAAANGTPFGIAYTDVTTSGLGYTNGDAYAGPVAGLQRQYIWPSTDKVAIAASSRNVFLHGGIGDDALAVSGGTNVLDGGTGSSFLTGGTGADGGTDTFFVDGRGSGVTWSTINGFHHGDAVTVFGFTGASTGLNRVTGAGAFSVDGVQGYQGATIHSELGGAGTGVNASLTIAGMSVADAQAKLTLSTGTVQGNTYLYVAYTG